MRNLGSAGLISSAIGLGATAFTGAYGPVTERECRGVIQLALDMGVTLIDAFDIHADGEVETLVGRALSRHRQDALIATHVGMRAGASGSGGAAVTDGSPGSLVEACEASLQRLNTEFIDIFYLPGMDLGVPVEESVGKLAELVSAGKIRYIGLNEPSADQLRRAQQVHPVSVLALQYSLWRHSGRSELLQAATELGIGVVACRPLARGLLASGSASAASARDQVILRAIEAEAAELDLGMPRLTLAWLMACRPDMVPVPSTRNLAHLEMNASAADIVLRGDTCGRLAKLSPG
jgi:aryl-alcohol dehydrogenase-like predicted oxidoreductase